MASVSFPTLVHECTHEFTLYIKMKSMGKVIFHVLLLADMCLIVKVPFISSFTAEPKSQMSHTEDVFSLDLFMRQNMCSRWLELAL